MRLRAGAGCCPVTNVFHCLETAADCGDPYPPATPAALQNRGAPRRKCGWPRLAALRPVPGYLRILRPTLTGSRRFAGVLPAAGTQRFRFARRGFAGPGSPFSRSIGFTPSASASFSTVRSVGEVRPPEPPTVRRARSRQVRRKPIAIAVSPRRLLGAAAQTFSRVGSAVLCCARQKSPPQGAQRRS